MATELDNQMIAIGAIHVKGNKWNIPIIGDMKIKEDLVIGDLLEMIYKKGLIEGTERGKKMVKKEILKLLND